MCRTSVSRTLTQCQYCWQKEKNKPQTFPDAASSVWREILPPVCILGGLTSSSATLLPHLHVQCLRSGVAPYISQAIHYVSHHVPSKKAVCPGISRACWIIHIPFHGRSRTTKTTRSNIRILPKIHLHIWCSCVPPLRTVGRLLPSSTCETPVKALSLKHSCARLVALSYVLISG